MSMRTLADHVLDIAQNAINAGATRIRLRVEETSEIFRFHVIDNGKGMDPPTLERIFDPFYTTRDKKIRRFGLGL
ncbi:MAG: ATP-binding protein, partial [Thermotogota bacterium]|nr:ATP-binding protein [Thermotogota bacterium]